MPAIAHQSPAVSITLSARQCFPISRNPDDVHGSRPFRSIAPQSLW